MALLDKDFVRSTSTVEQQQVSSDGTTTKLLVRLQDGMQVEAVVMTYTKGGMAFATSCVHCALIVGRIIMQNIVPCLLIEYWSPGMPCLHSHQTLPNRQQSKSGREQIQNKGYMILSVGAQILRRTS